MRNVLRLAPGLVLGLALALGAAPAAWAVYKVVGPDGSVTFTDVPPSSGDATLLSGQRAQRREPSPGTGDELPPQLRKLEQQAPVLIYTAPGCKACDDGIQLLRQRGVPYSEKTIVSPQDAQAFKAFDPQLQVPLLSVAGVRLSPGFNAGAWNQALDSAGYPQHSELPKDYRFPIPQPLTGNAAAAPGLNAAAPGPAGRASPPQPSVAPPPDPRAPPGFKF
jgi:glutaredoxin